MKSKLIVLFIFAFLVSFSQTNRGIITYKLLGIKKIMTADSIYVNKNALNYSKELILSLKFDEKMTIFNIEPNLTSQENLEDNSSNVTTVKGTYVKNFVTNKTTRFAYYDELGGNIAVENTNNINWKFLNEKKVISGYECYLAEGIFNDYDVFVKEI